MKIGEGPIRERWTRQPRGPGDEAVAGELLRIAAQHGPLGERRLGEVIARLRHSQPVRPRAVVLPMRSLVRHLAFVAALVLSGGVLSASVMRVMRAVHKPPISPPAIDTSKRPIQRSAGHRTEPAAPALPSETLEDCVQDPLPLAPPSALSSSPSCRSRLLGNRSCRTRRLSPPACPTRADASPSRRRPARRRSASQSSAPCRGRVSLPRWPLPCCRVGLLRWPRLVFQVKAKARAPQHLHSQRSSRPPSPCQAHRAWLRNRGWSPVPLPS